MKVLLVLAALILGEIQTAAAAGVIYHAHASNKCKYIIETPCPGGLRWSQDQKICVPLEEGKTCPVDKTAPTTSTAIKTATTTCPSDKESKLDLIIYIDGQRYLNSLFNQQVEFVDDFVRNYEIGKTRISVLQFGRDGNSVFSASGIGFDNAKTTEDILKQLDNFKQYGDKPGEVTGFYMLKNAVKYSFNATSGGRPDATHVVMILTGGRAKTPSVSKRLAKDLHKTDIKIIVVEVGDDVDDEVIHAIAGENSGNIFKMDNSEASEKIRKLLKSWTCEQ